jgi:hypothetical protein
VNFSTRRLQLLLPVVKPQITVVQMPPFQPYSCRKRLLIYNHNLA